MKNILLCVLSIFTSALVAQTPCVSGMAGTYPCNGYDLQSFTPCTAFGADNSNDSWGWTDAVSGIEYALLGLDNGVAFVDISDPVNPLYVGKLPTHTNPSLWRDVKVYNNYAFVVSEANGHGMQIFDLTRLRSVSNPPEIFTEDAHYNGFGGAHNIVINEQEGYAYGVGTSTYSGGPHFVDIQDPLNPVAAGGYSLDSYSHDGQVVTYNGPDSDYTGREIYIGSNTNEVVIVDITDKANPQGISTISYSSIAYTHQGWLTEDHAYFLLGDEIDEINFGFNTRTVVFNLNDLDNPQLSFEYSGPTAATDHNGYTKGDSFYLANYTAGLRVIDISNISSGSMVETGYFDVFTTNNNAGYNGAWNVYPYFESGNIVISSLVFSDPTYVPGLYIVKASSLGINDLALSENVSVYPNPGATKITVSAKNQVIDSAIISDVMGKILVGYTNINAESVSIDISAYSKGIYFIKINNSVTKKIIKQ
ncbi:MAG: choice-of-anchor B family protein [Flavobacteriales bacterium]|jgi:choice-of-anchor B domain-containing protein|nr:choice-of-anchor B family protein [Ulvibacter sp.]MDC1327283.1 choice-of-anchor B family protein [Ulvibacter sp.]